MYSHITYYGNNIYDFHYDATGMKRLRKVKYQPSLFLPAKQNERSDMTGLMKEKLKRKIFSTIEEYFKFKKEYENILDFHGDIEPIYQYSSEMYKNTANFNLKNIRSLIIDIEVYSEDGFPHPYIAAWPITSIAVKDTKSGMVYVAATKEYDKNKTELDLDPSTIHFKLCKTDKDILVWLLKLLRYLKPDILVGWYSDNFDFPYIINRFDYLFDDENVKNLLSPLGQKYCVDARQINDKDFRNTIKGFSLLDYMRLYQKYIFTPRESYKLDFIAEKEIGENKINYEEYGDLNTLWRKNPQKYIDYNIYDVELIYRMNKKLGLLDLACTVAYKAKCNYYDVMGTIKPWDCIAYNYLKKKGIAIPPRRDNHFEPFAGAYVKQPKPGIYKNIVSFDLNSLYPHIQQQWNISPECLVHDKQEIVTLSEISPTILNQEIKPDPNYIFAGNGHYFRKDKIGFIPTILREMYDERSVTKGEMLDWKQVLVDIKEEMKKRGISEK